MRWRAGGVVLGTLVLGLGLTSCVDGSIQQSGSADHVATEAYLRSRYRFEQEHAARFAVSERAVDRQVASLTKECSGVMTGAPRDKESEKLAQETVIVLSGTLVRSQAGSSMKYAHVVSQIQWSNSQVTRLVRAWLVEEAASVDPVPNPCVDMRAWVKSGYHRLPVSTTRFLEHAEAVTSGTRAEKRRLHVPPATKTGKVVLELLEPYESSKYAAFGRGLRELEAKLFGSDVAVVTSEESRLSRVLDQS